MTQKTSSKYLQPEPMTPLFRPSARWPLRLAALCALAAACSAPNSKTDAGAGETGVVRDAQPPTADGPAAVDGPLVRDGAGAPDGPEPGETFTFFGIGDSRSHPQEFGKLVKSMTTLDPAAIAIFNAGDITESGAQSQWSAHMEQITLNGGGRICADADSFSPNHIRYIGALGNHDVNSFGWRGRWTDRLSGQGKDLHFALTHKNTLFLVLDSVGSPLAQISWLGQVLKKHADKRWKIAVFHHPPYPCNSKSPFAWGDSWAREFEKHGVDLALVAHSHTYERTCPMVRGKCAGSGGVVYLNVGSAGVGGRKVDSNKQALSGLTSYSCSEILKESQGSWTYYCHFTVSDARIVQRCYEQNNTTAPRFTWTLDK